MTTEKEVDACFGWDLRECDIMEALHEMWEDERREARTAIVCALKSRVARASLERGN